MEMRVCHFSATAVDGHYFRNMSRGLTAEGVSVTCGSLAPASPPSWLGEQPEVGYFSLRTAKRSSYPTAVVRLARILRARRIDVLQTHLFDGAIVGIAAGRLARVPLLIVTRHHLDQHQLLDRPLHVNVDRLTAALADRVVVPAAAVRQHMIAVEGLKGDHIEAIHLGLDLETFRPDPEARRRVRDEFDFDDELVIGCVGRLDPDKGFDDLLDAARALFPQIPNLHLLIVGDHPDPANRERILAAAEALGIGDRVTLTGHRSDVAACMAAMDLLAHPSRTEALPQVVIEAMAVGTPVVATSVGGIPEIVVSGETGALVPPSDRESLAAAIADLSRSSDLRRRYSLAGVERAASHFDAGLMVRRHLSLYGRGRAA